MINVARDQIFKDLRTLSDALSQKPQDITFELGGLQITNVFCNGHLQLLLWSFDGKKDTDIPVHTHPSTVEHLGVLKGGAALCVLERQLHLIHPGESLIIPANTPHRIQCRAINGPSEGWAILIPPETGLIPDSEDGSCMMRNRGRCGGTPAECAKRAISKGEGENAGPRE